MLKTNFVPSCLNKIRFNKRDGLKIIDFFADENNFGFLYPIQSDDSKAEIIKSELFPEVYDNLCEENRFMVKYSKAIIGYRDTQRWIFMMNPSSPFCDYYDQNIGPHLANVSTFFVEYSDGAVFRIYIVLDKCDLKNFTESFNTWLIKVGQDIFD